MLQQKWVYPAFQYIQSFQTVRTFHSSMVINKRFEILKNYVNLKTADFNFLLLSRLFFLKIL